MPKKKRTYSKYDVWRKKTKNEFVRRLLKEGISVRRAVKRADRALENLQLSGYKRFGLTSNEVILANRYNASEIMVRSRLLYQKIETAPKEAGNVIGLYHAMQDRDYHLPSINFDQFLSTYAKLRSKMKREPSREELPDFVEQLGNQLGIKIPRAMKINISFIRRDVPIPELDYATSVAYIYKRAERAGLLRNVESQQQILRVAFNKALGEIDGNQTKIRMAVRALEGDFTPDLVEEARKKVRNFDSKPEEDRKKIIEGIRMKRLANLVPSAFEWYARQAVAKGIDPTYKAASKDIMKWLESAENRLFLARLATQWFARRPSY